MKISEWMKLNNLNSQEEVRQFFANNSVNGKYPVAMYSCLSCDEIIFDPSLGCPVCNKGELNGIGE